MADSPDRIRRIQHPQSYPPATPIFPSPDTQSGFNPVNFSVYPDWVPTADLEAFSGAILTMPERQLFQFLHDMPSRPVCTTGNCRNEYPPDIASRFLSGTVFAIQPCILPATESFAFALQHMASRHRDHLGQAARSLYPHVDVLLHLPVPGLKPNEVALAKLSDILKAHPTVSGQFLEALKNNYSFTRLARLL